MTINAYKTFRLRKDEVMVIILRATDVNLAREILVSGKLFDEVEITTKRVK